MGYIAKRESPKVCLLCVLYVDLKKVSVPGLRSLVVFLQPMGLSLALMK